MHEWEFAEDRSQDELLAQLNAHEEDGQRLAMADDCRQLGLRYQEDGDLDAAEAMYRRCLVLSEGMRDRRRAAMAYRLLGLLYEMRGDLDQGLFYLEEAHALHHQQELPVEVGRDCGYMGFVYLRMGDLGRAMGLFEEALALHQEQGDIAGQAEARGNMGNVALARGDGEGAAGLFREALVLYEQIDDAKGMGGQYRSLGELALAQGQTEEATTQFELALSHHGRAGYLLGQALDYAGLAACGVAAGQLDTAWQACQKNLELLQRTGHDVHLAAGQLQLGQVEMRRQRYAEACEAFAAALRLYRAAADRSGMALASRHLGDARSRHKPDDVGQAEVAYRRALDLYGDLKDREGQAQTYVGLGYVAVQAGDRTGAIGLWTAACEHYEVLGQRQRAEQLRQAIKGVWKGALLPSPKPLANRAG